MKNKTVRNAHDRLFRSAMADLKVAKDFLQTHLPPAIKEAINLDSLALQPNSYVDQSLKTVLSDVLYKASLKEGEPAYLYLLCEHESTSNPLMAFRIWQYVINIWADHIKQVKGKNKAKKLPLIFPLVFYTGKTVYSSSTDIRDLIQAPSSLIEQSLFKQTFQLIDVNQLTDDALQQQRWAGMLALMMKHIHDRNILLILRRILEPLRQLEQAGGTDFVVLLLNYCLNSGETFNTEEFVTIVQQGLSPEIGEKVMTIAEQLKAEGKAEGRVEGEMEALKKIAIKAIYKNLSLQEIQDLTGLSQENLLAIQNEIMH